jgi:CobQ-like glutamine amidotransferase family enzyme
MSLTIVRLYHDLLGTYGDQGNAEVLIHRARARGLAVELIEIAPHEPIPTQGDIYLLGGGEDGPQTAALEMLSKDGGLNTAVDNGATVFAVCAGFQIIGSTLPNSTGLPIDGLGLVDVETVYTDDPRSVGELVIAFHDDQTEHIFTGFENHQGLSILGHGVTPLGHVLHGIGNGRAGGNSSAPEGVHEGNVFGTYMHGPALVRNPDLADLVLASAVGALEPYHDPFAEDLAAERRETLLKLRK